MPRPKKPLFSSPYYSIKRIHLDSDTREALAYHLGIEQNQKHCSAMIDEVEEILAQYKGWDEGIKKSPTPASELIALESLRQAAKGLFNGLRGLDEFTKQTLYSYTPFKKFFRPTDPEASFQADATAVIYIIDRIDKAIEALTPHKKRGKRKDYALRRTMVFLFFLFNNYATNNIEQERRYFISDALKGAKIPHPDPNDQRAKFDKLLKGPF